MWTYIYTYMHETNTTTRCTCRRREQSRQAVCLEHDADGESASESEFEQGEPPLIAAMPRVSIVPLVSDIRSCWTSRVNRVRACLPCRVRHAVSQSRVCRVKEAVSDMSPMSAVYQDRNWVIRKRYQQGGSGVDCSTMASTVSVLSAFKAVSAVSCQFIQRCQLNMVPSCCG